MRGLAGGAVTPGGPPVIEAGMTSAAIVSDALLQRIRAEFLEMPGLQVTLRQAARLFHLDPVAADVALRILLEDGFLARSVRDGYRRAEG
jgi:hypothetical protein